MSRQKRRVSFNVLFGAAAFGALAGAIFSSNAAVSSRAADATTAFSHQMPAETNQLPSDVGRDELLAAFRDPTGKVRTGVYWYWLSGNASVEGVKKDVEAMKSVGIDRAYIGDIGVDGLERGPARTFGPLWREAIRAAFAAAAENGVEAGIFNSPGWSQSGGPWVSYRQAMRYLVSSETRVDGPRRGAKIALAKPEFVNDNQDEYQDVSVLAFPVPKDFDKKIVAAPDGGFDLKANAPTSISLTAPDGAEFVARSVKIEFKAAPIAGEATLFAIVDGEAKKLGAFKISRYNPELNVGFYPYAPVVGTFAATKATEFRLDVTSDRDGAGLTRVELRSAPQVAAVFDKTLTKMHETPHPMWDEYQWAPEVEIDDPETAIDPKKVVDLTANLGADGVLTWDVPAGNWVVLRAGMTPTRTENAPAVPEATGYEVDKMSRERTREHFDAYMGDLIDRLSPAENEAFTTIVQDSYEVGGQNFTDDFAAKFQASFGYDPTPFLPVYFGAVVQDRATSDRFLWDVRRFVADEIAYSYVGGLRDAANERGKKTWLECYGHWGFPGEFLQYGGQSDEIAGEYWSEGTLGDIENRIASSCGHIYGKTKIWAESNTCAGKPFWRSPVDMKKRTDRFFADGINNSLLHLYVQQPDERVPGFNAWFGNEFNRHNTWFEQLDLYVAYLKRSNYMLQQGLNVADVAYFIGEDAPKMTGVCDPPIPAGYQYDFINGEVLRETASVDAAGRLTLPHGTQYRVLVLPKLETARPEVLAKIKRLVEDGAFVLGPKPSRSPSLQNQPQADEDVKRLADELWGDVDGVAVKSRKVGKGTIANGLTLEEVFASLDCPPDFEAPADAPLVFGRRTMKSGDVYFVANQSDDALENVELTFRVAGKEPELWNPTTGEARPLRAWKTENGRTTLPLSFAAQESFFVVFAKPTDQTASGGSNELEPNELANVAGPWTVAFQSDEIKRGPSAPVVFETLSDWATSENDAIKYYSGTACYRTTCVLSEIPKDARVFLSLGAVSETAKVKINGKYVGGVWTAPYRLDVSEFVREGENDVEIEVVNCWANRLIGDAKLPENERKTWAPVNNYRPDSPLKKSGLIGPVVFSTSK